MRTTANFAPLIERRDRSTLPSPIGSSELPCGEWAAAGSAEAGGASCDKGHRRQRGALGNVSFEKVS
jgi:hypothetical protein